MKIKELLEAKKLPDVKEIYDYLTRLNNDIFKDQGNVDHSDENAHDEVMPLNPADPLDLAYSIHAEFEEQGVTEKDGEKLAFELVKYIKNNNLPSAPKGYVRDPKGKWA